MAARSLVDGVETRTDLPTSTHRKIYLVFRLTMGRRGRQKGVSLSRGLADANAAYYRTPHDAPYEVVLPKWFPRSTVEGTVYSGGDVLRPTRVIPGVPEGGRVFLDRCSAQMKDLGWEPTGPGLFTRPTTADGVLECAVWYMDDLDLTCRSPQAAHAEIDSRIKLDPLVSPPTPFLVGWDIIDGPDDSATVSMATYMHSVPSPQRSFRQFSHQALNSLIPQLDLCPKPDPLPADHQIHEALETVGKVGWLATAVPNAQIVHCVLSRLAHRDPLHAENLAIRYLEYVRTTVPTAHFSALDGDCLVSLYTDASYFPEAKSGYAGCAIQIGPAWWP